MMMEGLGNVANKYNIRMSRLKALFKNFLLTKYKNEKENTNPNKYNEYDPSEQLSKRYCIHNKRTSEISLFLEYLLKMELTDEYLFYELKKKLDDENLLEDLLDVNLPVEKLGKLKLGEDLVAFLYKMLKKNDIASWDLLRKWEKKIEHFTKSEQNHSEIYLNKYYPKNKHFNRIRNKLQRISCKFLEKHKIFQKAFANDLDSISLPSDDVTEKRLDNLHHYPIALDQFGERLENFRLPGQSVHQLLVGLTYALRKNKEINIVPSYSQSSTSLNLKATFKAKKDSYAKKMTHSANKAFPNKHIEKLFRKKSKIKKYIKSEKTLIKSLQNLKHDKAGWFDRMMFSLNLMKEGSKSCYQEIFKAIEKAVYEDLKKEKRARIKYWFLLYDDEPEEKYIHKHSFKDKPDKKKMKFKNKKYTYKTINEFMFSRDYDDNVMSNPEENEEKLDDDDNVCVDLESAKIQIFQNIKSVLTPEEGAEIMKFFYDNPMSLMNVSEGSCQIQENKTAQSNRFMKGETNKSFPLDPFIEKKDSYLSRLSEVRGRIVKDEDFIKHDVQNNYPFNTRASRGLKPIKKYKDFEPKKLKLISEEDRMKFIRPDSTKKNVKKRACDRPIKQNCYNWEQPKVLGKQVLPGTDIFIESPKIEELKSIEDSWKYTLPPFDYMKCGLPQDSFELVSNQILQKEILKQELMDIRREEFEKNKRKRFRKFGEVLGTTTKGRGSSKHSNPPPWHYNVKRWPPGPRNISLHPVPELNFIDNFINRYHFKDNKAKTCQALAKKLSKVTAIDIRTKETKQTPERMIKMWRNLSFQGMKMCET